MKSAHFESYVKIALILLIAALIGSIIILSWVPPVSRDALTHHLAVPKLYLQHGAIYEIPSIVFSYYPMNLDLLYIIPLYFGNDIVPKFIHFVFALLTAGLIYGYLAKKLGTIWALFGAIFFLSLPVIVKLSITVYVDLGLIFFSTASIMSLLKWIESRFQIKFLLLSAVCCGLALGTKYNGLIVLFILTVFIPLVFVSKSKGFFKVKETENKGSSIKVQYKAIGFGAVFFIIALLVFSPWLIRNYVWKKNPVYPLYNNLFNPQKTVSGDTLGVNTAQISSDELEMRSKRSSTRWSSFAIRKVIYSESWWEIALIPVRIFFQGRDDNPKYFDGKLSPFLFLLPFFAFFQLKNDPPALRTEKKILVFFTILYLLYAFFQTDMRIRYIAPIIPPLVILSVFGLYQLKNAVILARSGLPKRLLVGSLFVIALLMLGLNAVYIKKQFDIVIPFSYLSGRMDRNAYIAKYRPEYKVIQFANENLSPNTKILALFLGNRRYYSDREMIFGNSVFRKMIKSSDVAAEVSTELKKMGFTHLLIRYDLFNRWSAVQFNDKDSLMIKSTRF